MNNQGKSWGELLSCVTEQIVMVFPELPIRRTFLPVSSYQVYQLIQTIIGHGVWLSHGKPS
jgi:hypothetical protein